MMEWSIIFTGLTLSLAVCGFMVIAGVGDVPGQRSSHDNVTPTGGGLGILAAMGITGLMLGHYGYLSDAMAQILSLIWGVGLLGLCDDVFDLNPKYKLVLLMVLATAAVWVIGPVTDMPFGASDYEIPLWIGWSGSVLWVLVVVNIVNFMDGSNGLMLVVMSIAAAVLGYIARELAAPQTILLLAMLLVGMMGLLPYNLRNKAAIFSGDVGALTIGFTYAVAVLWMCSETPYEGSLYIGPVLILPLLADGLFTIIRRIRAGENIMQAHRSHLYQKMVQKGLPHLGVAFIYGIAAIAMAGFTIWSMSLDLHKFVNFLILPLLILAGLYLLAMRRFN